MTAPVLNPSGDQTPHRLLVTDLNIALNPNGTVNTVAPNFVPIQYVEDNDFNPDDAVMVESAIFGDNGWGNQDVLGATWHATITINHMVVPGTAAYDQTHTFLEQNAIGNFGNKRRCQLRFYDYDGNDPSGLFTPRGQAYMGFATWSWPAYGGGGTSDKRIVAVPFTGKGPLYKIGHPYPVTPVAPTITSLSPSSVAASGSQGKQVIITGTGFSGIVANGVKFGATNATSYVVESDSRIVASLPTLTAGSVNVTVTNAAGTSAAAVLTAT